MADWAESQAPLTDDSSPTLTGEPARQARREHKSVSAVIRDVLRTELVKS